MLHNLQSSHDDLSNLLIAKNFERDKISADNEHTQLGLHEITTCDENRSTDVICLYLRVHNGTELLFSPNWKWKYRNGRNKLTANETSNKNAPNNVSSVVSAVSGFHWLLVADKKHNLPFSETFCLLLQIVIFLTLSTVGMMTCDLQVIQSQLLYSSR